MPALQHMSQRQETIPSGGDPITALILLLLPLLIISVALIFVLIAPFIIYLVLRFRPGVTLSERCLLYTSPSPRDLSTSRMPSSA